MTDGQKHTQMAQVNADSIHLHMYQLISFLISSKHMHMADVIFLNLAILSFCYLLGFKNYSL